MLVEGLKESKQKEKLPVVNTIIGVSPRVNRDDQCLFEDLREV